jgi:hypothetical protein
MNTNAVLLLVLLGVSIGYGTLCFLSDHGTQTGHDVVCAVVHPHEYLGGGVIAPFFMLFTGLLALLLIPFLPQKFVSSLDKPPQSF